MRDLREWAETIEAHVEQQIQRCLDEIDRASVNLVTVPLSRGDDDLGAADLRLQRAHAALKETRVRLLPEEMRALALREAATRVGEFSIDEPAPLDPSSG